MLLWLKLALALASIITSIISALEKQKLLDEASRALLASRLTAALQEIKLAEETRAAVLADLAAHPERVREPDPYSRS